MKMESNKKDQKSNNQEKPKPRKKRILGVAKKPYKSKDVKIGLLVVLISLLAIFSCKRIEAEENTPFTILIYMCGSDLESTYGMATRDLIEMMNANPDERLTIFVYTGGALSWHNSYINPYSNSIYKVTGTGLETVVRFPSNSMGSKDSLSQFLSFSKSYISKSSRLGLIFWDHGGGARLGFGYDERHPFDSLTLLELKEALEESGLYFDFIGFDACLMGSIEVAESISEVSDYMVASEEVEPGTGWYYTDFLEAIKGRPGVYTEDLCKLIVDSYISSLEFLSDKTSYTLSVINLKKLKEINLEAIFKKVSEATTEELLHHTKYFSETNPVGEYDLGDFLRRAGIEDIFLSDVISYERHTRDDFGINGLSICLPIDSPDETKEEAPTKELDLSWHYDSDNNPFLNLTEEDYKDILAIERVMLLKDESGYIRLGSDNTFSFNKEGNLYADLEPTWVMIDGWVAPYETIGDTRGYIPCLLTRKGSDAALRVNLIVDMEYGRIEGGVIVEENGTLSKGSIGVYPGDTIKLLYSYYRNGIETIDPDYSVYESDPITIRRNTEIGDGYLDGDIAIYYRLKDKNGNYHETKKLDL